MEAIGETYTVKWLSHARSGTQLWEEEQVSIFLLDSETFLFSLFYTRFMYLMWVLRMLALLFGSINKIENSSLWSVAE